MPALLLPCFLDSAAHFRASTSTRVSWSDSKILLLASSVLLKTFPSVEGNRLSSSSLDDMISCRDGRIIYWSDGVDNEMFALV